MSEAGRDDDRHERKITDQDILKVFDNADEPVLTASEIAKALPVTRQALNYRLNRMHENGLVDRKDAGARSVVWWATVAPALSETARDEADSADRADAVSLDDLEAEFAADKE